MMTICILSALILQPNLPIRLENVEIALGSRWRVTFTEKGSDPLVDGDIGIKVRDLKKTNGTRVLKDVPSSVFGYPNNYSHHQIRKSHLYLIIADTTTRVDSSSLVWLFNDLTGQLKLVGRNLMNVNDDDAAKGLIQESGNADRLGGITIGGVQHHGMVYRKWSVDIKRETLLKGQWHAE